MRHGELLIGGQFLGGPCDQAIGKTVCRSPWDGRIVGAAAEASWSEAKAAAAAAAAAYGDWRRSRRQDRAELLARISETVRERREDLASLLVEEVGKPWTLALGEVDRMSLTFQLGAELAREARQESLDVSNDPRSNERQVSVGRFPIGPILAIVPYNWPFNLAAHKLAPALAAGNTVVLKGSDKASLCTLALGRLLHEAGVPAGVVNAIQADARTSERLAESEEFAMISFTGSPAVGWGLKRKFPERRVVLELGGDAYCAVFEDADWEAAMPGIVQSAFAYAGQICISTQHILVHSALYDAARERLAELTSHCPTGGPSDPDTVCGPLISEEAAERVEAFVREAEAAGARVLAGGSRRGTLFAPTLIEDVPSDCRLAREEVFGPVATLSRFDSENEAIARINSSQYGIHAAAFTRDRALAGRLYRELEVGGLLINDPPTLRFDSMPYGGVKRSGWGREGVRWAYWEMTEPKTLVSRGI